MTAANERPQGYSRVWRLCFPSLPRDVSSSVPLSALTSILPSLHSLSSPKTLSLSKDGNFDWFRSALPLSAQSSPCLPTHLCQQHVALVAIVFPEFFRFFGRFDCLGLAFQRVRIRQRFWWRSIGLVEYFAPLGGPIAVFWCRLDS